MVISCREKITTRKELTELYQIVVIAKYGNSEEEISLNESVMKWCGMIPMLIANTGNKINKGEELESSTYQLEISTK